MRGGVRSCRSATIVHSCKAMRIVACYYTVFVATCFWFYRYSINKDNCFTTAKRRNARTMSPHDKKAEEEKSSTGSSTVTASDAKKYEQDGEEARKIAHYLPFFPFKGIPRFYDIGGFLYEPAVFRRIVDIFAHRYRTIGIDVVAGLDARGFVLGPPIALALDKPFIMMRKQGKMPNTISSSDYKTEYGNRNGLTVQRDKIRPGHRVLIIDDLVATGGTLGSAISLVKMLEGVVVECACVVELKMFINPAEDSGVPSRTKLFRELGHHETPVWGLISEDCLTREAELHKDYVDDGEEH